MLKRSQPRVFPGNSGSPDSDTIGIAQAAQDLSAQVAEFDRKAASWSNGRTVADLVRT
jgi:hypothetical protein